MNSASFVLKIITEPEQSFFKQGISVTEIRVKFTGEKLTFNSNNVFTISIWENSSSNLIKNYKINDHLIVEGYISLRENLTSSKKYSRKKHIELSVKNVYSFL